MIQTTDNELVKQAQGGEFQAFEFLVSRHEQPLYATAWHLTQNHHDAQDVVQNTFLSAINYIVDWKTDLAQIVQRREVWEIPDQAVLQLCQSPRGCR